MKRELKVYAAFLKMHFLSALEYKGWWLMLLQTAVVCIGDMLATILMFNRFGGIGLWTAERILLIYGLAVTSFGLAETFCRGFDYFPWRMIRSGDFDRLLLRPRSLVTQVAASYFHIHRLARVFTGLALVIICLARQGIPATPFVVLGVILSLMGGMAMYMGVFVMSSGIAIFTIQALDWIFIFTNASYQVTRIPMEYMPLVFKRLFTFVLPMLVISYYPASAISGWGEPKWTAFLAIPAGFAFLFVSLLVWRVGVRHYKSTGS